MTDKISSIVDFDNSNYPKLVCFLIFEYLIPPATPLADGLVLTSKSFQQLAYNHPKITSNFNIRLDSAFSLKNNTDGNKYKLQIGSDIAPSHQRSIIVKDFGTSIAQSVKDNHFSDLKHIREYTIGSNVSLSQILPFFAYFENCIHIMSWNNCRFLSQTTRSHLTPQDKLAYLQNIQITKSDNSNFNSNTNENSKNNEKNIKNSIDIKNFVDSSEITDDVKDIDEVELHGKFINCCQSVPPILTKCQVFDLTLKSTSQWNRISNISGIKIDNKFPNLLYLQLNIESSKFLNKLQYFLDETPSIRILSVNFEFIPPRRWSGRRRVHMAQHAPLLPGVGVGSGTGQQDALIAAMTATQEISKIPFIIPKNIEILGLGLNNEAINAVEIDFNQCKDNLKYISCAQGGDCILSLFGGNGKVSDGYGGSYKFNNVKVAKVPKKLKFVSVLNNSLWLVLFENDLIDSIINNGCNIYLPNYNRNKNIAEKHLQGKMVTEWPCFEQVKEMIESQKTRKLLRDMKDSRKMHYLTDFFQHKL